MGFRAVISLDRGSPNFGIAIRSTAHTEASPSLSRRSQALGRLIVWLPGSLDSFAFRLAASFPFPFPFEVAVDAASLPYLDDAVVDFVDGLQGRGFTVQNPNASGSCGCGKSFNV